MKINIAICDNNRLICNDIFKLIIAQKPAANVFTFTSKETLLNAPEDFDIFFLDIKGIGGLEIAKTLRERRTKSILIFVTGYSEFMSEAFDVNAFHYLLKPIDAQKFSQVLSRACAEIENAETQAEKFLLLKVDGVNKKFFLRDIFYIESDNKKVTVHATTGNYSAAAKMDALEIALADYFYRCHRCYLVNLEKISAYANDTIQLTNGENILIAGRKYPAFVKIYLRYAKNGGVVNV